MAILPRVSLEDSNYVHEYPRLDPACWSVDFDAQKWQTNSIPMPFLESTFFNKGVEVIVPDIDQAPMNDASIRYAHLRKQDNWALGILKQESTKNLVIETSRKFVNFVKTNQHQLPDFVFHITAEHLINNSKTYPVPKDLVHKQVRINSFQTFIDYIDFTSKNGCINGFIAQLCIIWNFALDIARYLELECYKRLDEDYDNLIVPTKVYNFIKRKKCSSETADFFFGNTLLLDYSGLLNGITPRYQFMCRTQIDPGMEGVTLLSGYKICFKNFVSGASGMANAFSNLFGMLDIDIESAQGVQLQDIMTAFVVGTSVHSKEELEYSFLLAKEMYAMHPSAYIKPKIGKVEGVSEDGTKIVAQES